jgi:L-alanine-DL-glutamate epimerase-like enolase superfamily enzyme
MQHELVESPFEPVNGWMLPPEGPGLGIEVIPEVVEFYRSEREVGAAA